MKIELTLTNREIEYLGTILQADKETLGELVVDDEAFKEDIELNESLDSKISDALANSAAAAVKKVIGKKK